MKIPTASASRVVTAVPRNAALFACFALASCAPAPSNVGQGGGTSQGQGGGAAGFVIGGTISGLNVSGLTLDGGLAGVVTPDAGDTSFTLPNTLPGGAAYAVQIASLPLGKQCTVDNASGTVQGTSVTSIVVTCVGAWTWVSGRSTTSANGVYGIQGVPNSGNYPGARSSAASWVDATGTFWLFGGNGYPADGDLGDLNDLWTYSPTTGQWTWMHGGDTISASGRYGTLLIPDAGNVPPARSQAQNWLDSQGRLWLFGGTRIGFGPDGGSSSTYLNDLWRYSPGNNQWTWVGGTQGGNVASIYGPKGLADAGSFPGGRASGATWIDSQGNIWLFGGLGRPTGDELAFSDLWSFSPAATEWTWVGGKSEPNEAPIYGELGVSDAGNSPGARFYTATWTDGHGRLWLFGGNVPVVSLLSGFNDLWNYSTSTKQWTWVGGETIGSARGVYGGKLAPDGGNYPRARYVATTWTDSTGKFWLFGGYDAPPNAGSGFFNDLWHYSPGTNQWTWVGGAQAGNQSGIYGVRGVPDARNSPGARGGASSWADSQGRLWLFGGQMKLTARLNDLWVYAP